MINLGFWGKLKDDLSRRGGIFCLAPMADVTDCAFREIIAKYSKNRENRDKLVFWTEFVSADGLCDKLGRKKLSHMLKFKEIERPIVAQVFGANHDNMKKACQYVASLGFDGIDINMGCPDRSVVSQGGGAGMIKNPENARKIIQAAHAGIASAGSKIPVSVKTRIGFNKEEIDTWIPELLKENISVLTIHLRTSKELSLVPAHWELMKRIVKLRDELSPETLIIGNGDVLDIEDGKKKIAETGCDGVMLGRAMFGNPWIFNPPSSMEPPISLEDKLRALIEHVQIFDKELLKPKHKNFASMKKHFKAYVSGFDGAKELRVKLMEANNAKEVQEIINDFLQKIG